MKGGNDEQKKPKRKASTYILTLVAIKNKVKELDLPEDVKDGPALSKVVSAYMKENDSDVDRTVKSIKKNLDSMVSKYRKANKEIKAKMAAKRAAKAAAKNN